MHRYAHPYLLFRTRLAHHALLHVAATLKSSAEIVLLAFGPVLLGLFACIALPGLIAPTLPWPQALALVAAQVGVAALPALLLRKRLHPADVLQWTRPLPIAPRWRWSADAAVAAMLMAPLALVYAISTAIWLYQWPDWLRPVAGRSVGLTLLSLLLAWGASTLALARRAHLPAAARPRRRAKAAAVYLPRTPTPRLLHLWHHLFWLPYWRADNVVGMQQTLLLLGALASVAAWRWHPAPVPPALWGGLASLLLMVLTDRGDQAVREQVALLRPVMAAWPLRTGRLYLLAAAFGLLPGAAVLAAFAALMLGMAGIDSHVARGAAAQIGGTGSFGHIGHLGGVAADTAAVIGPAFSTRAAVVWLGAAALAQIAIVAPRNAGARGRVGIVIGATLLLTAIGSELWN